MAVARAGFPAYEQRRTPAPTTPARRWRGRPISENDVHSFEIDGFCRQQRPGDHDSDGRPIFTIAKIQGPIEPDLVLPVGRKPGPEKRNLTRIPLIFLAE